MSKSTITTMQRKQQRPLTKTELSHYREHGYVAIEDFFPTDELQALDDHLDRFAAGEAANAFEHKGQDYRGWIMRLGLATPQTAAFCTDERVVDLISPLVHPGIAIYSAKLVAKEPYDTNICHWHQDDAYYTQHSQSQTRMSTWIPLQDSTRENGCLQLIPGSHHRGLQPASSKEGGTCNLAIDSKIDLENRIYLPTRAGTIVLFSALLWHASDGNQTDQRRRAFIVSYQEATAQGGNADQWQILRAA